MYDTYRNDVLRRLDDVPEPAEESRPLNLWAATDEEALAWWLSRKER